MLLGNALRVLKTLIRILKPQTAYFATHNVNPISSRYGFDRGQPIDRYFIERFLRKNASLIKGHTLEVQDDRYTKQFGTGVRKSDILDIVKNDKATIIGDLRNLHMLKDNTYDCLIITQVFQYLDDVSKGISECFRILKPGGVLLATIPSIARIDHTQGVKGDHWRFTKASAKYLFENIFPKKNVEITVIGNALVGRGIWVGLAKEDLTEEQLNYIDESFPCFITIKAVKPR